MFWAIAMLLAGAPQAKVIRAEAFTQTGATDKEAADCTREVKDSLVQQGYRLEDKGAELQLSGLISRTGERLIIDTQLSRVSDRTLVAAARVYCADKDAVTCSRTAAEQLGSRLREATGVRVKLVTPGSRAR